MGLRVGYSLLIILPILAIPAVHPTTLPAGTNRPDPHAIIAAHNILRAEMGVSGLTWSKSLAAKAKHWAEELQARHNCAMIHSGPGENLYWASALVHKTRTGIDSQWVISRSVQEITEQHVVDSWGSERKWYDYQSNSCTAPKGKSCSHYTQVVWGETTEVGCSSAVCPDKSQVWVCNYSPAGNIVSQRPY